MKSIIKILKRFLSPVKQWLKKDYHILRVGEGNSWVYLAYVPEVFNHLDDETYLGRHQNLREAIKMVEVFNQLGYNVYLQRYNSRHSLPKKINPKIIIGLEPNFDRACEKWPNAKKIYYATGAYWEFANKQILTMTQYLNSTYNGNIRLHRMVRPHQAPQKADYILQIGSSYTVNTYPEELKSKIFCIDQSSTADSMEKNYAPENHFFFMASGGNVLKGTSLLIEYFNKHQNLTLHWVGPIEDDFYHTMKQLISPNIKTYGFLNIASEAMKEIVSKCNFVIYPSGTEGCPGAVINSMKMGLIPIVTPWAAFDGIEQVGFVMNDWSVESVGKGVKWGLSMNKNEIIRRSKESRKIVTTKFCLERFGEQLKAYMARIVKA